MVSNLLEFHTTTTTHSPRSVTGQGCGPISTSLGFDSRGCISSVGKRRGRYIMDRPGEDPLPHGLVRKCLSPHARLRDFPEAAWQRRCNQTATRGEWGGNDGPRARGSAGTPRAITISLATAHTHTHTPRKIEVVCDSNHVLLLPVIRSVLLLLPN